MAPPFWVQAMRSLAVDAAALGQQLAPGQRTDFDALWDRLRLPRPEELPGVPPPFALPLPLLSWFSAASLRRKGRRVGRPAVQAASLAAVVGYLAVRLHDDRIDEAAGSEATALLTGSALLAHHLRLLAEAAGPGAAPAVLGHAATAWSQYADGMAVEARASAAGARWTEPMWRASLRRYAPMALPSIALYVRAGHTDLVPRLVAVHAAFGEAHQLLEDTVDLGDDVRGQRAGWVAQWCGASENPAASARFGYLAGVGPVLDAAQDALGVARAIAVELGETELCGHLDARAEAMRRWLQDRQNALVQALLGAGRGAPTARA